MTEEDQKKIDRMNQFVNEKGTLQADGTVIISGKDFRDFNQELKEKNKQGWENIWNKIAQVNEEIKAKEKIMSETREYNEGAKIFIEGLIKEMREERINDRQDPEVIKYDLGVLKHNFLEQWDQAQKAPKEKAEILLEQMKSYLWNERDKADRQYEPESMEHCLFSLDDMFWEQRKQTALRFMNENEGQERQEKQSESTPPERRNINSKEKIMSDVNENEGQARDPKEEAFLNTVHQRKVIADALKAGKLSCLPGADGFADTTPAVNLVNGTFYHGANLLFLKEHQKENGFPSAEYVTFGQIEKARKDNPDLSIRKGQKGVSIYVSEKNEETGEWENKSFRLFNVAQTTNPTVMKEWAEQQRQEKLQEKLEYLQTQYGTGYQLPEPKQKEPGPEIVCASTDPEKYLGQYLAAVSMGGKFKASPEQAAEFAKKLEGTLFERMENGHTNPFKLEKISNEASKYCKEVIREVRIETQKQNQPQQEQTQSHKRSI